MSKSPIIDFAPCLMGIPANVGRNPPIIVNKPYNTANTSPRASAMATFLFAETSSPSPMKLNVGDLVSNHMQRLVNAMFENSAIKNIITASTGDTNFAPLTAMQQRIIESVATPEYKRNYASTCFQYCNGIIFV